MATRTPAPLVARRTSTAAKPAARPAPQARTAGAGSGVPRFAANKSAGPSTQSVAPSSRAVSSRNDRWENEAHRVAHTATSTPNVGAALRRDPSTPQTAFAAPVTQTPPAKATHRPPATSRSHSASASAPRVTVSSGFRPSPAALNTAPSTGPPALTATAPIIAGTNSSPLAPAIRARLESILGVNLSAIRIHTGRAAHEAAESYHARAFTVGTHVYLRSNESPTDLTLIAHETAHAVQQSATVHAAAPRGPPSSVPSRSANLSRAPPGMVQRWPSMDDVKSVGSAIGGAVTDPLGTAGKVVDAAGEAIAEGFWAVVDRLAPQEIADLLHQVRDEGFWGMLKKKISSAIDFVFSALKSQGGTSAKIATIFETLIGKAKPILAALAAGDCKPLFAAVKSLTDTLGKMAGDAWDKIVEFLSPVGEWLSNVWQKFGAPVVDFLKEFASDTWDWIQGIGKKLWDLTKPVRDFYSGAWTEIKNLLGFGEGSDDDGSTGLIGWIKEKAGEAWDALKEELKPVIEPIKKAAKAIADFLPLNAILNLREKINEWMDKATAMADNMDQPDDVAENQDLLRDVILPGVKRAIGTLRGKVTEASTWVTEAIGGVVTKATDFLSGLSANTLLSPFKAGLDWLSKEATELGEWASQKVVKLFGFVDQALVTLEGWLEPVINTLKKLFAALGNLMDRLGDLILGPLLLVPKCIRDPIKDFIVTRILSQIPVFAQLVQLPDIWAKVSPAFRAAIVAVFKDGNLFRAAWIFFRTCLSLLGVPPQLVTNLIRNAAKAIKDVIKNPVGFLGNVLTAMKLGLLQFVDRIGKHLLDGAVSWLLSGVKGPGIKIPDPFAINLKNVFDLVMQVLDLNKAKILDRIEKKKGKEVADKVRKALAVGEKLLEWLTVLVNEGPSGLWKHLQKELSNLWSTMLNMVIDYLIGKIVQQATIWVTKTLASGGLSVIIDAIKAVYDALSVIAQYLKQLLEVANSVCEGIIDIAKGVLGKAADMVEQAAARLIPMVLAFLAKTLGIGDLPVVIGEGIQKVRKKVEDAIDSLIDKTFAALDWLKEKGKEALNSLKEWWEAREDFDTESGEHHHIAIEGEDASAKVNVHSDLVGLDDAVTRVEANPKAPAGQRTKARTLHGNITTTITEMKGVSVGTRPDKSDPNYKKLREQNKKIRGYFREITPIFAKYLFDSDDEVPAKPEIKLTGDGTKASTADIGHLSRNRPMGNVPGSASPVGWPALVETNLTENAPFYVRLHLINENFGGSNSTDNLVPGPTLHNNLHKNGVENMLKTFVGDRPNKSKTNKGVVWMTAKVSYHSGEGNWSQTVKDTGIKGNMFASAIDVTWGLEKKVGTEWQREGVSGTYHVGPMPLPPFLAKHDSKLKRALA